MGKKKRSERNSSNNKNSNISKEKKIYYGPKVKRMRNISNNSEEGKTTTISTMLTMCH